MAQCVICCGVIPRTHKGEPIMLSITNDFHIASYYKGGEFHLGELDTCLVVMWLRSSMLLMISK